MPLCDHNYLKYYALKKDDVVLDLGATNGEFAQDYLLEMQRNKCRYICVEPNVWVLRNLTNLLVDKFPDRSMLISTGLWKYDGCLDFVITDGFLVNAFEAHRDKNLGRVVRVDRTPVLTLDTVFKITDININFLKADIEGAELEVFLASKLFYTKVENFAIAAYHLIDNAETCVKLEPYFKSLGYKVTVDTEIGKPFSTMLYGSKQ